MRLGIIGTGHMADQMAHAAKFVDGIEVAAVLSREMSRASQFCSENAPNAQPHGDIETLLKQVDGVYIATPATQHADMIKITLEHRIPVLCEKPFTTSQADTIALASHARETGVLAMEAIWTLALPAYQELQRLLTDQLNPADPALLSFDFSFPRRLSNATEGSSTEDYSMLLDRAVYGYAAAIFFMGPVQDQVAFAASDFDDLDTCAQLRLVHETGNISLITLSTNLIGPNRLEVASTAGFARLGPPSLAAETLFWHPSGKSGHATGQTKKYTLKSRLKSISMLRKMRARLQSVGNFHGYGASSYAPILREFQKTVAQGKTESSLVPLSMTEKIAALTRDALQQVTAS